MKKAKKNIAKKIGIAALVFFICAIAAVELLKSDWAKEKARLLLVNALNESGFQFQIEKIEGDLPQFVRLQGVIVQNEGWEIDIQTVEARLSLIRLLKKEIAFTSLNLDGVSWRRPEPPESPELEEGEPAAAPPKPLRLPKFPFAIYAEQFSVTNSAVAPSFFADFEGRFRLSDRKSFLQIRAKRQGFPRSAARLAAILSKGELQLRIFVKTPTLQVFSSGLPPIDERKIDADVKAELLASGPLSSFLQGDLDAFKGQIRGAAIPRNVPMVDPLKTAIERDWTFFAKFKGLAFSNVSATTDLFRLKGMASLDSSFHLSEADFLLVSDRLIPTLPLPSSGRLLAQTQLKWEEETLQISSSWRIPLLTLDGFKAEQLQGKGSASWNNGTLSGSAQTAAEFLSEQWEAKTDFSWKPKESLFLSNAEVKAPYLYGQGNLELRPDLLLSGITEVTVDNLQTLHIPDLELFGKLQARGEWKPLVEPGVSVQGLYLDLTASDFYFGTFVAQKASLYSDLLDPFHTIQGNIDLSLEQMRWGNLQFATATLETSAQEGSRPFRLFAEGRWKHPVEIHIDGSWDIENGNFTADIQNWDGYYFNHPFALAEPVQFEWSSDVFRLRGLDFSLADAQITAFIDRKGETTAAGLKLVDLPIDFLSVNPLDLPLVGSLNLEAEIHEERGQLKGDLKATLEKVEIEDVDLPENTLNASGSFQGHFERNRLELQGSLQARSAPFLELDLSLPVHLSIWPFQAEILPFMKAKGHVAFDGRVEDFLDFFDLGSHRLDGNLKCDLRFSNTLNKPHLEGYCTFKNGLYQNYYSGTELHNIDAEWQAEKDLLRLRSLTAQDAPQKGTFAAEGQIAVRMEDLFPFRFDLSFSRLNFVQIDLVSAEANGKIHIEGNRTSALARGTIEVVESELTIPDHIPRPLPNLQVVYVNPTHPVLPPEPIEHKPYPLFLDLHVSTPDGILIAGRGLQSVWNGDFDIGGTYSSITAKGKLELSSGEFVFSGRSFKLNEGSLSFSGKEHEMPYLNIAGSLAQKGVQITARMKGPLNSPQVTFQSAPPLPLSSIMSYLLFGQNIGEITGFQALQLATSIASLAGQGPDIMESTRKALGVDRLRIISSDQGGDETIALQVGTYVTEGVIVSFSQGAEDSSSNISIEVEIKDNFSFQAETQQQTEQGKFSFKWYVNY